MRPSGETSVCLALLGEDKTLIGFKLDTFWSLSEGIKNAYPKIHGMNRNKQIDVHLITNIKSKIGELKYEEQKNGFIRTIEGQKFVDYLRKFGDTLYLVAYPCPPEGENYVYPREQMEGFLKDLPEPMFLYSFKWEGFASNHKNAYIISNDIPAI